MPMGHQPIRDSFIVNWSRTKLNVLILLPGLAVLETKPNRTFQKKNWALSARELKMRNPDQEPIVRPPGQRLTRHRPGWKKKTNPDRSASTKVRR